jgi:hypothetical protein
VRAVCCKCCDETSGSGATELVNIIRDKIQYFKILIVKLVKPHMKIDLGGLNAVCKTYDTCLYGACADLEI